MTQLHSWLDAIKTRLVEIAALPADWDSYKCQPVSRKALWIAAQIIDDLASDPLVPRPCVTAGPNKSVEIEWHRNGYDVEIEVTDDAIVTSITQWVVYPLVGYDARILNRAIECIKIECGRRE